MEKKRIFAAIDISEEAGEGVARYVQQLRETFPDISAKWEKPEKLHITVKFVGGITEDALKEFIAGVAAAASATPPFSITISGTGGFLKRSSRANVLWLGLQSRSVNGTTEMIEELAAKIDRNIATKRFHPHLTIARLKDPENANKLIQGHLAATFGPVTFDADEVVIYESTLLPTGSVYNVVSRHRLGKDA